MANSIQTYIAPWALPYEEIPFKLFWKENIEFDEIIITISKDLELVELFNVNEYLVNENKITIKSIKKVKDIINYFGGVIKSKTIFMELKASRELEILFMNKGEIIYKNLLAARIFRPELSFIEPPGSIIVDGIHNPVIPITLKYTGFGEINLELYGTFKGKIVTSGKNLITELIKKLLDVKPLDGSKETQPSVQISEDFIKEITDQLLAYIENPDDDMKDVVDELKQSITKTDIIKRVEDILYERVEYILIGMVLDLIEKNPANNIKMLNSETSISTILQAPIETLEIRIQYYDAMNNKYPEINLPIKVERIDTLKDIIIDIPIKIKRVQMEPFINVRDMKIE